MNFFNNILEKKISESLESSFFVIDKEAGRTSHDEVHFLRKSLSKFLGHKIKVGHSGTLDPKVTGVLVLASGKSVRGLEYILLSEKVYIADFLFHKKVSKDELLVNLEKFKGKIMQLPPVKSAVKRQEREREVYKLNLINFDKNGRWAKLLCAVERGTYIRKLAHDIGVSMNVNSSMGDLQRIAAGVFSTTNSHIISEKNFSKMLDIFKAERNIIKKYKKYICLKKYMYPLSEVFDRLEKTEKMKKVFVKRQSTKYILSGTKPRVKNIDIEKMKHKHAVTLQKNNILNFNKGEVVSIFYKKKLIGIGELLENFPRENFNLLSKKEYIEYQETEIMKLVKVFN
jgi:tRNA U55 pseudouridine synthase TruB